MEMSQENKAAVPATLPAFLRIRADLDLRGRIEQISQFQESGGGYSDVYSGYLKDEDGQVAKVAVKKLRSNIQREKGIEKEITKELYVWSKLDHPRVLRLEGFFMEGDSFPMLVSKWMDGGTVVEYLEAHPETDILLLVLKIAEGVNYLHDSDVIHSDIKPNNILMSQAGDPVLCDFGLSRRISQVQTMQFTDPSVPNGTFRFMAKELLDTAQAQNSKASDVWAFGMTVYVLITGKLPYNACKNDAQVYSRILDGKRPLRPSDLDEWHVQKQVLWHICKLCWRGRPGRPPMSRVLSGLQHAYETFGSQKRPALHANEAFYESLWCLVPFTPGIENYKDFQYIIDNDPRASRFRIFMGVSTRSAEISFAVAKTTPPIHTRSGKMEYFASAWCRGAMMPATYKFVEAQFCVAMDGQEIVVADGKRYSILVFIPELMELIPTSNGVVPHGRIPIHGGKAKDENLLFYAVGAADGNWRIGWTAPYIGGAVIGFDGKARFIKNSYEILCWRDDLWFNKTTAHVERQGRERPQIAGDSE